MLFFTNVNYAQNKTTEVYNKEVKILIKQTINLPPNILTVELTNLTDGIIHTSPMGFNDNRIFLENAEGDVNEYCIWAKSNAIEIQPKSTKTWDIDIDAILNLFSHKGFQKPNIYNIKLKIIYRDVDRQKQELMSKPFSYVKKSNPDLAFKLRAKESDNNTLMFYISNFGDGDTINISNQYAMVITDSKGCSITYFSKEKSKFIPLLNSRFHVYDFKMNKILKSYKSAGLQQSGEYTIQWEFNYSYSDHKEYEITTPEFTYTKH